MFEGKLPQPGERSAPGPGFGGDDRLRALTWADLVARLAAARDLRAAVEPANCPSDASFDADSARHVAAHHNGKHVINLDDSADGKSTDGTAPKTEYEALSGGLPRAARN